MKTNVEDEFLLFFFFDEERKSSEVLSRVFLACIPLFKQCTFVGLLVRVFFFSFFHSFFWRISPPLLFTLSFSTFLCLCVVVVVFLLWGRIATHVQLRTLLSFFLLLLLF